MRGIKRIFHLSLLRRHDVQRDVDDELAFHLAMREAKLRAAGIPEADAARLARHRFGNLDDIRTACVIETEQLARQERAARWIDEFRRDVAFAFRSLRRAKGFTAAVVLTLALGLGANVIMFSVINRVVLHPVSGVRDPSTLFEVSDVVPYPEYQDLQQRIPSLALGAVSERRIALGQGRSTEHTTGALVTGNFFAIAGVSAVLGRMLQPADDVAGVAPVAVLTHQYWTRVFGADSSLIGRTVTVNGAPVTVVGVAAPSFSGLHLGVVPSVWLPVHAWTAIAPSSQRSLHIESRNWGWLRVIGRLPNGMTLDGAQHALTSAMSTIDPGTPPRVLAERARARTAQEAALPRGARAGVVGFVAVLSAVVVLVLITACANIAGLMLSRAAYREREVGVRIALGAGRGRLLRQLLTESLVLATLGGVAGLALFASLRAALRHVTLPGGADASTIALDLDGRLLTFAVALTLVTGVLVGLVPALQASRADAVSSLKGVRGRGSRQRLRGALVTAQVAVALVLLVGTGLFARALQRALAIDLGFRPGPLVTFTVDAGLAQLERTGALAYYRAVLARVASIAGVRDVTVTASSPLSNDVDRESAVISGYTPAPGELVMLERNTVGPRYHETLGIPLVSGRGFTDRDNETALPVVIINETAAKRYFDGRSPVGGAITIGKTTYQIVGVSRDAVYHELNESPKPYIYFPVLQSEAGVGAPTIIARVDRDGSSALARIIGVASSVNPAVPVFDASTMTQRLRAMLAPQLAGAWLLGGFGALALLVAVVGIYGVVAYSVSQRTREIGIRMALGARSSSVLGLVVRGNVALIALGVPIGLGIGVLLARAMSRFLYGIAVTDPLTFAGMSLVMIIVGLVASLIPARRAVRVDPLVALRSDN